jgi:hypothetical protein
MRGRLIACAVFASAALSAAVAQAATRNFQSPTGNIECEVSSLARLGAYCQTFKPAVSVTLHTNGRTRICRGNGCIGNGPDNMTTLRYGRSITVGPFRCTSTTRWMRCVVRRSGHGFTIAAQGIRRF